MSKTITIRIDEQLAEWLDRTAARTGMPKGRIIRGHLEKARAAAPEQGFLKLAGTVRGPRNLSSRKGFSRS